MSGQFEHWADRFMRRRRPRAGMVWLGRQIEPYAPARHSITIAHTNLRGDPGMVAPIIQINEPAGGRSASGAGIEMNNGR